ncbi:MAG: DUF4157 domain-containing protein [Blastocatellia bacterium]
MENSRGYSEATESASPQIPVPQPTADQRAGAVDSNLHASIGNARFAAAATNGSPPDDGSSFTLQSSYGNAAVARAFIQRKPEGESIPGVTAAPTEGQTTPDATVAPARALIVEDAAETFEPGQMKKSDFLSQLRAAVCKTTAEALADTPWSEAGCPYIDQWFSYYSKQSAEHVEQAIRRYAPAAGRATEASGYITAVTGRVRDGVSKWTATGEMPEGLPAVMPGAGVLGAVAGAVSAIGKIFFKGREGGARKDSDPRAIQSQLGAGQPLDGGVRTQMESAFGESLSDVEIYTDGNAAGVSSDLRARAFTVGNQIAFGAGEYRPGTPVGDALIAHELAHVLQQRSGGTSVESKQVETTDYNTLEEDADQAAVGAVVSTWGKATGKLAVVAKNSMPALKSGLRLQRCGSEAATYPGPASPDVTGKFLGTWEQLSSSSITGGVEIVGPGNKPGRTGGGFDTFQDALAYAHVGIASYEAEGGVIIKKDERYFAYTITLDSWLYDFTRENVEEDISSLETTESQVDGIQAFITEDGYAAPVTVSFSTSQSIPVHIVDRERAGGYWHSTQDADASGYKNMLSDLAEGRASGLNAEGYVALFKGLLKANAQTRLEENRKLLTDEEGKYKNTQTDNKHWQRLREVIEKDKELATYQRLYRQKAMDNSAMIGRAGMAILTSSVVQGWWDEMAVYHRLSNEAKEARNTLRVEYPPLAVLDTDDISTDTSNKEVFERISEGFKDVKDMITDVSIRIHEEDIPLGKMGPLVTETTQQMGVTDEKRKSGDAMSVAVLDWLDSQDRKEAIITWSGTIVSLVLGIAAIFASGGTALLLGVSGSLVGLGTAAYSFERAEDIYAAAQAGTGGKPMVDDPEAARFNYIMGWVNLILAGLDLGIAAKAGTTMLQGARAAEKLAGMAGSDILKSLKPEQIVQFDKAMQLRRANQLAESELILSKLKATLGEETFAKASSVFGRANTVEELFGASTKISEQARNALRNVDEAVLQKLPALGEEAVETVGKFINRSGPEAARFVSEMGDDALKLIIRGGGEADTVRKVFSALGVERTRKILNLPAMTVAKLDDLLKVTTDAVQLERLLTHIDNPAELERLINSAGLRSGPDAVRLDRTLQGMGPGKKSIPDVEAALETQKKIDNKILYGEPKATPPPGTPPTGVAREIRGAHSPQILSDPDFNILSKTTNADGTIEVRFNKLLSKGPPPVYSKTKSSSTLAPLSWSDNVILEAGDKVAKSSPVRVAPDGRTLHLQKVDGIEWCVIKDNSGTITSSFPTGGNPVPF